MARILGLDIGKATIGISSSDILEITAQPKGTIKYENDNLDIFLEKLIKVVNEMKPSKIVYGLPKNMDGTSSTTTEYIIKAIDMAKEKIDLEFIPMDERWTSIAAQKMIISGGFKKSQRKQKNDEVASSIILQSFLDSQI